MPGPRIVSRTSNEWSRYIARPIHVPLIVGETYLTWIRRTIESVTLMELLQPRLEGGSEALCERLSNGRTIRCLRARYIYHTRGRYSGWIWREQDLGEILLAREELPKLRAVT